MILELLRQPAYVVSTVSFPALFYLIFALPESTSKESSNFLLASFSCFSVFGVVFLQFGVGVAQERTRSWYSFLKTLPTHGFQIILARFLSVLFFSALSAGFLIFLAVSFAEVSMSFSEWIHFLTALFLVGILFCPMGLSLGYWSTERSSVPIGNLIYLPLTFAGGLWKPPSLLPDSIQKISKHLPTRHYGEMAWSAVQGKTAESNHITSLLLFSLICCLVAYLGYRKDFKSR
jgi:ABC-2 type transport system permease protein